MYFHRLNSPKQFLRWTVLLTSLAVVFISINFVLLCGASVRVVQDQPADLADILKRCASYCDRLANAVLDFVCLEKVEETIANFAVLQASKSADRAGFEDTQNLNAIAKAPEQALMNSRIRVRNRIRSVFTYDYQLIQDKAGHVTETRTLLKDNGRVTREKNAPLKTKVFGYTFIAMGPANLLSRDRQSLFDFEIVKETTLNKELVVIIQATPKAGSTHDILSGKIWVRKSDASVVQIEWVPESVGRYEEITKFAKQLGAEPVLKVNTEYGYEKNGLRFPSRYAIEEKYSFPTGQPLVRSTTKVTMSDYKFFTVETEVEIRNENSPR